MYLIGFEKEIGSGDKYSEGFMKEYGVKLVRGVTLTSDLQF